MIGIIVCGALTMFLSHFFISAFKAFKCESKVPIITARQKSIAFNNVVKNPAVLSDIQIFGVLTVFIATAGLPVFITGGKAPETADQVLLLWLPLRQYMGFIFPLILLYLNPAIRNHFKREFWDMAPPWTQSYNPYIIPLESPPKNIKASGSAVFEAGIGNDLKAMASTATMITRFDMNRTDENSAGNDFNGTLQKRRLTFGSIKTESNDMEDLEKYLDTMTHAKVIDLSKSCTIVNVRPRFE